MQVDNDVLYRGIANQPSHTYSSLCLSDFLSFHTLNNEIFITDFCETLQARIVIFGMQFENDVLYCEIVNQPSHAYSSLYLFFLYYEIVQARVVIFGMQVDNDVLYHEIANQLSCLFFPLTVHFLFFPYFE